MIVPSTVMQARALLGRWILVLAAMLKRLPAGAAGSYISAVSCGKAPNR